jgi:outer membrane protein assembly factor BamB
VGADLYVTREDGTTYVLKTTKGSAELIATNELNEFTVATLVFSDGQLFLRTERHLYCLAAAKSP